MPSRKRGVSISHRYASRCRCATVRRSRISTYFPVFRMGESSLKCIYFTEKCMSFSLSNVPVGICAMLRSFLYCRVPSLQDASGSCSPISISAEANKGILDDFVLDREMDNDVADDPGGERGPPLASASRDEELMYDFWASLSFVTSKREGVGQSYANQFQDQRYWAAEIRIFGGRKLDYTETQSSKHHTALFGQKPFAHLLHPAGTYHYSYTDASFVGALVYLLTTGTQSIFTAPSLLGRRTRCGSRRAGPTRDRARLSFLLRCGHDLHGNGH